jgi:hypothetical protein
MKLEITVTLDSGGTVSIKGEELSAEDVNEVFAILGGYTVEAIQTPEPLDLPLPSVSQSQKDAFVEGFQEGRPTEEKA